MSLVSVIIVSHNSSGCLPSCLASLELEDGRKHEIVVIDNASTDETCVLLRERFPWVRLVVNEQNRGFAAAVNQGLRGAKGRYILLLNPDATLLPPSLPTLIQFLETTPEAAAAGPRQWLDSDMIWQWSITPRPPNWRLLLHKHLLFRPFSRAKRCLTEQWALNRAIWRRNLPCRVSFLSGAALLVRATALEQVGGLDEGYFLFYEDVDLCRRLRSHGWLLFAVPQAAVVHRGFHSVGVARGKRRHQLTTSTTRYLRLHENLLTNAVWSLMAARRARHKPPSYPKTPRMRQIDLHEAGHALTTERLWVEIGLEPLFLYAAAAEIDATTLALPEQLAELARHETLHMRVAPVDRTGQLGGFIPQWILRRAGTSTA